jgi:hypothetical protein
MKVMLANWLEERDLSTTATCASVCSDTEINILDDHSL